MDLCLKKREPISYCNTRKRPCGLSPAFQAANSRMARIPLAKVVASFVICSEAQGRDAQALLFIESSEGNFEELRFMFSWMVLVVVAFLFSPAYIMVLLSFILFYVCAKKRVIARKAITQNIREKGHTCNQV